MHILWSLVLLAVGLSDALNFGQSVNVDKTAPLRFMRRDVPYSNDTVSQLDIPKDPSSSTSTLTTSTVTSSSSSLTVSSTISPPAPPSDSRPSDLGDPTFPSTTSSSTTPIDTGTLTNASTTTVSTRPPALTPPGLPSFTGVFTNYSTSIDLNATTPFATCTGSVTYFGTVPPTVYVTVTEGFDVTVTASNVSVTATPTLITPLPACSETIVYESVDPQASIVASTDNSSKRPQFVTATGLPNAPAPPALATLPGSPSAASSAVYSSVDYTSTVVVTKKTPVTVVVPPTTSLDINFNFPTPTPTSSPGNGGGNNGGSSGGGNGGQAGGSGSNGNANGGSGGSTQAPSLPAPNAFASIGNVGSTKGSLVVNTNTPTTVGIGNIIASIINSPFVTASPVTHVPGAAAAPLTTTIDSVPVVVLPSNSVAIGGQTFAIPNLVPTTVQVSGVVFTLEPSQIIAPSATVTLAQPQRQEIVTPVLTATITTTVGDLTLTVGPTAAIISGTTYRIGSGAPATTVLVDGTSVSIGAGGVGLPSTTVAPGGVTGSPFVVYTTEGLTFSVGSTVAVVGGTTYRVGSNAPELTATIGSDHVTVSFGPDGVGLASTTLAPGGSPFVVVTVDGLTFSVDGTEAIIQGTTYRIGSNAPQVITEVGSGHLSVSFGPGGVGLKSTTILPATASSRSSQPARTGSRSTSATATATATATQSALASSGASARAYESVSGLLGWSLLATPLLWLAL